jgi:hypothetical protein
MMMYRMYITLWKKVQTIKSSKEIIIKKGCSIK